MIRRNIILVPFPFDDLTTTKARPAICLTEPIGVHRHVVVVFITSQIPSDLLDTDVTVDIAQPYFISTGLRVTSVLRLHRLVTISTSIIRRHLGSLPSGVQREVDQKLRQLFDLSHISNSTEKDDRGGLK